MERVEQALIAPVVLRPWLWRDALRLAQPGWWRRRPFLPLPAPDYLAFRMETQYGRAEAPAEVADIVDYLKWCRTMRRLSR